jgi:hypothetical protein
MSDWMSDRWRPTETAAAATAANMASAGVPGAGRSRKDGLLTAAGAILLVLAWLPWARFGFGQGDDYVDSSDSSWERLPRPVSVLLVGVALALIVVPRLRPYRRWALVTTIVVTWFSWFAASIAALAIKPENYGGNAPWGILGGLFVAILASVGAVQFARARAWDRRWAGKDG